MRALLLLLCGSLAWAQSPFEIPDFRQAVPPQVREFLRLTDEQVRTITANNREFAIFVAAKGIRMAQVQREIVEETAREPLNPGALGARYVELEVIRREIAERQRNLLRANVGVLTDAQKPRLQALEEAARLQPVIGGAQSVNLLPGGCVTGFYQQMMGSFDLSGVLRGCGVPVAVPVITPGPGQGMGPGPGGQP